jgi:uncharacterized protein YdbL (DUF1318 family)
MSTAKWRAANKAHTTEYYKKYRQAIKHDSEKYERLLQLNRARNKRYYERKKASEASNDSASETMKEANGI